MRRIGEFGDPDGLSELLLRLTVSSTVYCFFMSSPWGFKVPQRRVPAFHIMTSGGGWMEIDGQPQAVRLSSGDLVILPRGDGHLVRDSPKTSALPWLGDVLEDTPPVYGRLALGGGGRRSELLCGGFAIDPVAGRQLLGVLPTLIHLRGSEGLAPEWLVGLIRMIATEMAASGPGSEAVVTRLTDALLAQAIRHSLVEVDRTLDQAAAYSDPQIAKALRLMRGHPEHPWTVPELAAAVSMSRSTFAERFRAAMAETPMQHLTRFRMARAAEYLRDTKAGIREIARLTGYDSEVSVSKAFRRQFGVAPGVYRKSRT
ncbi:MAG TPA: AraC family transcriptional regulator [Verrucomicrobiae bacterium]|nr:AraC family transcriptional regulator [Verrucomicrobiae bacterium]